MKKWKGFSNLISIKAFLAIAVITTAIVGAVSVTQILSDRSVNDIVGTNELREKQIDNGSKVNVSAGITNRITGTEEFDTTPGPGNDVSPDDDIIRTFDDITWYVKPVVNPNSTLSDLESAEVSNAVINEGVILKFEAEANIPSQYNDEENVVAWDTDYMKWLNNVTISENGRKISGEYEWRFVGEVQAADVALRFKLNVLAAPNNMVITPNISVEVLGGNKVSDIDFIRNSSNPSAAINSMNKPITVSASPDYNVELADANRINHYVTANDGTRDRSGKLYELNMILSLDATKHPAGKGLKGLEIPRGDVSFNLNFELRKEDGNGRLIPLTESEKDNILIWNYKKNLSGPEGVIPSRLFDLIPTSANIADYGIGTAPWGAYNPHSSDNEERAVYETGDISIVHNNDARLTADGKTISSATVTVSNYKFGTTFPKKANWFDKTFTNQGCFASIFMEYILELNIDGVLDSSNSESSGYKYVLKVTDDNFHATSFSGTEVTRQVKNIDDTNNDDKVEKQIIQNNGWFTQGIWYEYVKERNLEDNLKGNAEVYRDEHIYARYIISVEGERDGRRLYSIDRLIKFDANGVEPEQREGKWYEVNEKDSNTTIKQWFVAKKDGTNWQSQEERNATHIEDLDLYESYEDLLNAGKVCVGEFFETDREGGFTVDSYQMWLYLHVKEDAQLNETYGAQIETNCFATKLDRSRYSQSIRNGYSSYPLEVELKMGDDYFKTEYEANGTIKEGTHNQPDYRGNTILVVAAEQKIEINVVKAGEIIKNTDNRGNIIKTAFDLDKNETRVRYKLTPKLGTYGMDGAIEGVTEKITVTLPKGLIYNYGSSTEYGSPEVSYDDNGQEILTWTLSDITVGEDLAPIYFEADIFEEINDKDYVTKAVISEYIPEGKETRLGITDIERRTDKATITTTTNASHTLFKGTTKAIVEEGEDLNYRIVTQNIENNIDDNDFRLLDVLPYNNDGRGSKINNTYVLKNITIKAYDRSTDAEKSTSGLRLYTTTSDSITANMNASEINLSRTDTWHQESNFGDIGREVRAFAIDGTLERNTKLEIELNLTPTKFTSSEIYVNDASAQTTNGSTTLKTPYIPIRGSKRTITGTVWSDDNKNGIMDAEEEKIKGATIKLLDQNGNQVNDDYGNPITTTSDDSGNYTFEELKKANYILEVSYEIDDGTVELTTMNAGDDEKVNSKFDQSTKRTGEITELNNSGAADYKVEYQNAGLIIKKNIKRSISGTVWLDSNKNGIMDAEEERLSGIELKLIYNSEEITSEPEDIQDVEDETAASTITNSNGQYIFENVEKGKYRVKIYYSSDERLDLLTEFGIGDDIEINSKFHPENNSTDIIDLTQEEEIEYKVEYQNAGLIHEDDNTTTVEVDNTVNRTITGTVWLDSNKNGIMETDENVIKDIVLNLLKENGEIVKDDAGNPITTKTNAEGKYIFTNLDKENYIVEIIFNNQDGIVRLTQMNAGSDITVNNKFNSTNNRTEVITDFSRTDREIKDVKYQNAGLIYDISANDNVTEVEIDNIANRTITGTVWLDLNKNGIIDEDEDTIQDVVLKLFKEDGSAVLDSEGNPITTKTNAEGKYIFDSLEKENYIVEIEFDTKDGIVKLTEMNAGNDGTINSKFSQSSNRTNLITDLSRTDREINKVEYQHAGLVYDISFNDNTADIDIENTANRTISGTVWLDLNQDGIMDSGEDLLKDAVIKLIDEEGNPVLDGNGNQIMAITDAYGEYTIANLENKNYILEIEYDGGEGNIILTQMGAGDDLTINSKFNPETIKTDIITDFTTSGNETLFDIKYQNAGIIYILPEQKDNKVEEEFENDPLTYIEIIKTDSQTGDGVKDAQFGIYSEEALIEEGKLEESHKVATLTTGDDGRVKSDGLAPGIYYIQEIQAPEGYIKSDEIKRVEITEAGQVIQVPFKNDPIGYIRIKKEDSTLGIPLKGAKFGVYPEDALTEGDKLDEEKRMTTLETGDDGYTSTIPLPPGKYYVREEVAPDGYRLNTDIVEVIINKKVLETNPIEVVISDIQLGVENKFAEMYITVRKVVSAEADANQMNIEGLGEVLVYSNSVGRRDTNSVPGNAMEIATNKGVWLAGHNSLEEDAEIGGYVEKGYDPPVWVTVENDAYATESIVVIPPLGTPLRDYKKDQTMYIVVCSITILAMMGLFSYKQVLIERTYVKIKKKEDEEERKKTDE